MTMLLSEAVARRRSCRDYAEEPIPLDVLRGVIAAAQGVNGEEGRRTVPSAHALYPLRLYVVAGEVEGLATGIHAVEEAGEGALRLHRKGDARAALEAAALDVQPWLRSAPCIIAICADLAAAAQAFAEQPPYGTRGVRYAHIEAGAAAQMVQLRAAAEGLGSVLVAGFRDEATAAALSLPAPVAPVALMCLGWPRD